MAAGEIIYGTSFWQNIRSSFSQVEVGIKNLKVAVMYDYAVITGAILKICPIGSDFPTSDDVPFGVHVRYMSGWTVIGDKVNTNYKYVEDFDAALRDNRDVYGNVIDWEPVARPVSYFGKPADSNHPYWYRYRNEYGPMIVSETFSDKLKDITQCQRIT